MIDLGWKLNHPLVDNVWIMGGEPLDQDIRKLETMVKHFTLYPVKIWLWTRYNNIPKSLMKIIHFAKIGKYMKDKEGYTDERFGIELASGNQRILQIQ